MNNGYISLHRCIFDNWIWKDKPFSQGQAWIDLLLLARHEDGKIFYQGQLIEAKRGSIYRSVSSLAERWGWSRGKTDRFLKLLESDEMIQTNSTTHGTTITIVKYDDFQSQGKTDRKTKKKPMGNQRETDGKPTDTYNKDNNVNNDNKDNKYYFDDPELNKTFLSFIEHRKKMKSPMSDDAIRLALNNLNKLATTKEDKIAIINQSIMQGWKGLFPLGKNKGKETPQRYDTSGRHTTSI